MFALRESVALPSAATVAGLQRRLRRNPLHATGAGGAAATGRLSMRFQPRRSLRDGTICGAVAQIWQPTQSGGNIGAMTTPAADLADVAGWALRQACGSAATWPSGVVAVSATAALLCEHDTPDQVAEALQESGLPPERLELLLAESELADTGVELLMALSSLRDLGIGIRLDDFGGETCSLTPLRRLPLTGITLARSLVRGAPDDYEDTAVLRAVVGLAQSFRLSVVADGVEHETQRHFLTELGCDAAQGPLIGAATWAGMLG